MTAKGSPVRGAASSRIAAGAGKKMNARDANVSMVPYMPKLEAFVPQQGQLPVSVVAPADGAVNGDATNVNNVDDGIVPQPAVNALPPPASPTNRGYYTATLEPHSIKHLGTVSHGESADATRLERNVVPVATIPQQPRKRGIGWVQK